MWSTGSASTPSRYTRSTWRRPRRFTPDPSVAREPFLYYPARPWPHKNHARLFEAFALLRGDQPELRLVLTGAGHDASLPAGVEALGDTDL